MAQQPTMQDPPTVPIEVQVTVRVADPAHKRRPFQFFANLKGAAHSFSRFDLALLGVGIVVYIFTRFFALSSFPIYFFCDEAIVTNLAQDLINNRFYDGDGNFLPPYFPAGGRWPTSLSVYLQTIGVILFGKSVYVTRATVAAVSILCAIGIALTLKLIFKNRFWWSGVLILAVIPTAFVHSRTAFEHTNMVSFYACFLCSYLLYRYRSPKFIFLALLFGGLTFYSYTNGQGVMLVSGVLLLFSDLRFHLRQDPKIMVGVLGMLVVLAAPYLRQQYLHPGTSLEHQLQTLDSYWVRDIPLGEKLLTFGKLYVEGLNPLYLFLPNDVDWIRHRYKGLGHLSQYLMPFVLIGFTVCLSRWRSSAHRVLLIAVLAAPFSAALVEVMITRVSVIIVPASIMAVISISQIKAWLGNFFSLPYKPLAVGLAAVLATASFALLHNALVKGPTWYSDYGLYGMQYGAEQLSSAVKDELAKDAGATIIVSHNWANDPNAFIEFFLTIAERQRVKTESMEDFLKYKNKLNSNLLFALSSDEYNFATSSNKVVVSTPLRTLAYPNGEIGFYFVKMKYVDNADSIFTAESEQRRKFVETNIE